MIEMIIRRVSNALAWRFRRLVSWQLKLLGRRQFAAAVEELSNELVTTSEINGAVIRFWVCSPILLDRAMNVMTKEPDMIDWINQFPDGSVFWDVGANVGVFSLYAGLKPKTTILAFEPGGGNYDVLCRNIQINSLSNVKAYCLAFSRDSRLGVLNMASSAVGTALNQFGDAGDMSRYAERSTQNVVQGMIGFNMDDFIARFDPPFPSHLKIDVDGIEWPILQGAEKTLRDPRLRSLVAELTISDKEEYALTLAFLDECGFILASKGEIQTAAGEQGCNHVFVKAGGVSA
jgi:FkbM family methyltransferase